MDYHRLAGQVARKIAAGATFRHAFREVMKENEINDAWDVHASAIAKILARRPRGTKKRGRINKKECRGILKECLLGEAVAGAEIAAAERNDHLLRDP